MNSNSNFNTMIEFYNRLVNGSTSDAIFVCSALDEHAKNIPLRNDVIIEFYEFSLQFFDRVFGEDVTGRSDSDLPPDWNMLRCGGWLRKLSSISCYISPDSTSTSHASKSLHSSSTPQFSQHHQQQQTSGMTQTGLQLVNILSFYSNVMDILKRGNGYFNLDLKLLPFKIRDLLIGQDDASIQNIIQFTFTYNIRQLRLLFIESGYLVPSSQQLSLPPFHYFLILLARYPSIDENILSDAVGDDFSSSHHVKRVQRLKPNMGIISLLQTNPYFSLLRHYLNVLLPRYKSASGESMIGLKLESELFLRIAVEYWMNLSHVVRSNHAQYHQRYLLTSSSGGVGSSSGGTNIHSTVALGSSSHHTKTAPMNISTGHGGRMTVTSNGMDSFTVMLPYFPLTVTLVDDNPPAYITPSLQCTYLLLVHLLSDPKLPSACEYTAVTRYAALVDATIVNRGVSQNTTNTMSSKTMTAATPLPSIQDMYAFMYQQQQIQSSTRIQPAQQSQSLPVCPVALSIVQESLFDMLRTIFSRGDHSGYSALVFHQAVQVWLLYIQPWTANTAGNVTKDTRYTFQWDFYISQNLHFYTTLLGMFLHAVSLVSVHPTDPDGAAFLNSLEKVLKCFNGELLNKINQLTVGFNNWFEYLMIQVCLVSHHKNSSTSSSSSSSSSKVMMDFLPTLPVIRPNNNESLLIHRFATLSHHSLLFPDFSDKCVYSLDALDILSNLLLTPADSSITSTGETQSTPSTTTALSGHATATAMSTAEAKSKKVRVLNILRPLVEICRHDESDGHKVDRSLNNSSGSSIGRLNHLAASIISIGGIVANITNDTSLLTNININMDVHIKEDCMKILRSLQKMVKVDQESVALWMWEQLRDTFAEDEGGRRSREAAVYSTQIVMRSIDHLKNILSSSSSSVSSPSSTADKTKASSTTTTTAEADAIMNLNLSPRYGMDSLDAPLASYEWSPMVIMTVSISKYINQLLHLPRDQESIYRDFRSCILFAFQNMSIMTSQDTSTTTTTTSSAVKNPIIALLSCIRMNIRILANITLLVILVFLTLLFVLYKLIRGDYKLFNVIILVIVFLSLMKCVQNITKFYNQNQQQSILSSDTLKIRDDVTNQLTDYGKKQVVSGNIVCRKESIRYVGDALNKPYCSYEIRWLTRLCIVLSEWLNKRYGLPVENGKDNTTTITTGQQRDIISSSSVTWTWQIILTKAWNNRQLRNPVESILRCCRFNLRALSRHHTLLTLAVTMIMMICIKPVMAKVMSVCVTIGVLTVFGILEYRRFSMLKHHYHQQQQEEDKEEAAKRMTNSASAAIAASNSNSSSTS